MKTEYHRLINRIPLMGVLVFALLYLYSASLYPGGSQADSNSIGFDWLHNYWCNLMNELAMNGMANPARSFAIAAMVILCGSLAIFFYQFSEFLTSSRTWKLLIRRGGLLSMLFAVLMFSPYHDLMTIISSVFGLLVVIGIIKEIYRSSLLLYKVTGAFCLILLGLNNVIYYSTLGIAWLPLVQKVTLVIVLCWILGLNFEIRKEIELIGKEAPRYCPPHRTQAIFISAVFILPFTFIQNRQTMIFSFLRKVIFLPFRLIFAFLKLPIQFALGMLQLLKAAIQLPFKGMRRLVGRIRGRKLRRRRLSEPVPLYKEDELASQIFDLDTNDHGRIQA